MVDILALLHPNLKRKLATTDLAPLTEVLVIGMIGHPAQHLVGQENIQEQEDVTIQHLLMVETIVKVN